MSEHPHTTDDSAPVSGDQPLRSEFALGHDDPKPGSIAFIGVVGSIVVYLVIVGMAGFYLMFEQWEVERKVYSATWEEVRDYKVEVYQQLASPSTVPYDRMKPAGGNAETEPVEPDPAVDVGEGRNGERITEHGTRLGEAMRAVTEELDE